MDTLVQNKVLKDAMTVAIVCNQFGDTGKGKFVDLLSTWADVIARGTGGANAGHTIKIGSVEHVFHLIPSGILHDRAGKYNIIGRGVVLDPRVVVKELDLLDKASLPYERLRLSMNAKLVLPQHLVMDRIKEAKSGKEIGTTGRGIGPCYEDHTGRRGLVLNDILNRDVFVRKLKRNLAHHNTVLSTLDPDMQFTKKIMEHEHLANGAYFSQTQRFDLDVIVEMYATTYAGRIGAMITDTEARLRDYVGRKKILLEGAQGYLLSVDYGSHPYVTSSDASIEGLAKGVGIRVRDVDLVLGIVKAPYMTRVGVGPFPTEYGGERSEKHCQAEGMTIDLEQELYFDNALHHDNEFLRGIAIRKIGGEKGATTGRPRRVGRLDLPLLRYSTQTNGNKVILTKLDVFDDADKIEICKAYVYKGPAYRMGKYTLKQGHILFCAPQDPEILKHCEPIYGKLPGWNQKTPGIRTYEELPQKMRDLVEYIERKAKVEVVMISLGPEREQTIVRGGAAGIRS
ncbi:adenylosuccinate synthetase [Candidatus Woesearchaeota archaeon]|nr:adenylosuccinate synthetase [Candidatus Woesearchaeota archaeon]